MDHEFSTTGSHFVPVLSEQTRDLLIRATRRGITLLLQSPETGCRTGISQGGDHSALRLGVSETGGIWVARQVLGSSGIRLV